MIMYLFRSANIVNCYLNSIYDGSFGIFKKTGSFGFNRCRYLIQVLFQVIEYFTRLKNNSICELTPRQCITMGRSFTLFFAAEYHDFHQVLSLSWLSLLKSKILRLKRQENAWRAKWEGLSVKCFKTSKYMNVLFFGLILVFFSHFSST